MLCSGTDITDFQVLLKHSAKCISTVFMLSVTMIDVDGNFCHLVLLHAYIFVFCLVPRIPSMSTLSTSKTVMTIIHWLQAVRLPLQFTVTLLLWCFDDVFFCMI